VAELNPDMILQLGKKAVDTALQKGADEAEAFINEFLETSVSIERGQINKNLRKKGQGLGIRAVYNNAIGFSYTNMLDDKSVNETAAEAVKSARASKLDKDWPGFPTPKKYGITKDTFDKKLASISSEELVNIAVEMLKESVNIDKRVLAAFGSVQASLSSKAVVNSHGIEAYDKGTSVGCFLGTIAREGNQVTPICAEFNSDRMHNIDPAWVGREAAKRAVSALNSKKADSGNTTVIFGHRALYGLLYYTFINSVKADRVQREQSVLKGKIGERIASVEVTIHDDGLMTNGMQTWKFDDEGVPRRKTPILEKGVLKHYLYDCYTSKKDTIESTGNAWRREPAQYLSTPTIEATNFTITSGNKSPDTLIEEVDEGAMVYGLQGAHSSNPSTGEYSVVATPAWKIEKGEITHPIKAAMLAGTISDFWNNVSGIANNTRKINQLVAPWIRAENIKIIGK
jgi:PmbA protein